MNKNVGAIVLSRFDSSRLPGKVLRKVKNKALIQYVLERAYRVKGVKGVCVATSRRGIDDPIVDFCEHNDVPVFRGSGEDVAERFLECMKFFNWDAAVRINGDSPLHNSELLSEAVQIYSPDHVDIVTNVFPRSYPVGMSVELVSQSALQKAYYKMKKASNFEHVTEYFYENKNDFNFQSLPQNKVDHPNLRLVVDTKSDFERFKWLINTLGKEYISAKYENLINLYLSYEKQQK